MRIAFILFVLLQLHVVSRCQQIIPLYEGNIINSIQTPDEESIKEEGGIARISNISRPTLTTYIPAKPSAKGTAVIICPGGGYAINAIGHEGTMVAKKLNEAGITAFVLKYRLPSNKTMQNPEIGPLQDAQQAIKIVRSRAKEWGINAERIGIMGFSAGGHLASTAATHFTKSYIDNPSKISLRPDFMILLYPVISFQDSICHKGSRQRLIGEKPTPENIMLFSNELQVTSDTPPSFLVHASDDASVKPANSILFYLALLKYKVPSELHIYQNGGHGFGLTNKATKDQWFERCLAWLSANKWLE